jgi:prepilin-type N-terminal cleavage/methylation domain-containing protein
MKTTTPRHKTLRRAPRRHAGFTLVELIAVLAIVLLIGSVVLALNPGNPGGLVAAQNTAASLFKAARLKAQTPLAPRDGKTLFNTRARVLILKDPTEMEQHLRLMRVIVGGAELDPKNPNPNPEAKDYFWYSTNLEVVLPKGTYMIDEEAVVANGQEAFDTKQRSSVSHRDSMSKTMLLNSQLDDARGSKDGEGDKEWYFYEFADDGTSNMLSATFMIGEGMWSQGKKQPIFNNNKDISGLWISPSGETIPYSDSSEMLKDTQ